MDFKRSEQRLIYSHSASLSTHEYRLSPPSVRGMALCDCAGYVQSNAVGLVAMFGLRGEPFDRYRDSTLFSTRKNPFISSG